MSFSDKDSFGLPMPDDPDPFGVRALEELGLEIKEAGTKRPVSLEVFEYRPSPTSPIFPLFSSRQSADLSRRNSNQSVKSLNRFLRNSTDVAPPQTIPEAPREENDLQQPIKQPSFIVESPIELPTASTLISSPIPPPILEEDESSSHTSLSDDPFAGFSDYDSSSDIEVSDAEYEDESEPEFEEVVIAAPTTIIAQQHTLSRPRLVTIPPKRSATASKRLSTSGVQKRLSVAGKPKLPRRSSRRVQPSEVVLPPQPVTPELVSDSASIESTEKSSSARTSVDGRKERRVSQELYGGFIGDAGNPWLEEEVHAGFMLSAPGKEVKGVDVGGEAERETWHEAPSSPVR